MQYNARTPSIQQSNTINNISQEVPWNCYDIETVLKIKMLLRFFSCGSIGCLKFKVFYILVAYKRLLIKKTACIYWLLTIDKYKLSERSLIQIQAH